MEKKKLFIVTGELSGDKHASLVVEHLLQNRNDIEIEAIGGENLKKAGVKLFIDHTKAHMSAMGLTPKTAVMVRKIAPMGDPIELLLRGYVLTLRIDDAKEIEVSPIEE